MNEGRGTQCIVKQGMDAISARTLFQQIKQLLEDDEKMVEEILGVHKSSVYNMQGFGSSSTVIHKNVVYAPHMCIKLHYTNVLEPIFGKDFWIIPKIGNNHFEGRVGKSQKYRHIRGMGQSNIIISYNMATCEFKFTAAVSESSKEIVEEIRNNENKNKMVLEQIRRKLEGKFFYDVEYQVWQYVALVEQSSGAVVDARNKNNAITLPMCYIIEPKDLDFSITNVVDKEMANIQNNYLHIIENKDKVIYIY